MSTKYKEVPTMEYTELDEFIGKAVNTAERLLTHGSNNKIYIYEKMIGTTLELSLIYEKNDNKTVAFKGSWHFQVEPLESELQEAREKIYGQLVSEAIACLAFTSDMVLNTPLPPVPPDSIDGYEVHMLKGNGIKIKGK